MTGTDLAHDTAFDSELAIPDDLANLSTDALWQEYEKVACDLVTKIRRMALVARALEDRGEDLSRIRPDLLTWLRKIGRGQVDATLFHRFHESPLLMKRMAALPLPDQKRLGAGQSVPLVEKTANGSTTARTVNPVLLRPREAARVFGPQGIRSEAEQAALLRDQLTPPDRPPSIVVTADRDRHVVLVNGLAVEPKPILAALAKLGYVLEKPTDPFVIEKARLLDERRAAEAKNHEKLTPLAYRGLSGTLALDPKRRIYSGQVLDIPEALTYRGQTTTEARLDFEAAVNGYLERRKADA